MKLKWTLSDSGTWAVASCAGHVVTAPEVLALGMRVFYAPEMDGPLDENGWPGPKVPNTSDKSDTGTVSEDWTDANGRRSFVITWDRWQDGSVEPDLDEAQADGRLATVDGWALPLTEAAAKAWRERAEAAEAAQRWISVSERPFEVHLDSDDLRIVTFEPIVSRRPHARIHVTAGGPPHLHWCGDGWRADSPCWPEAVAAAPAVEAHLDATAPGWRDEVCAFASLLAPVSAPCQERAAGPATPRPQPAGGPGPEVEK